MIQWFKSRLKKQREWFRIGYPTAQMQGYKGKDGNLYFTVTQEGTTIHFRIDRDTAFRLSEWLGRVYPHRGENVVQFPAPKLSILPTQRDSSGDNPTP